MFKIVSDPETYPIREVDLTSAAGGLILTPKGGGASRDLLFERPDGGLNVARRARRMELSLEAGALDGAQVEAFQEVLNLTADGAPRVPSYIFPPFDSSTLISAPFQGSAMGWIRNAADGTLDLSALSFSRAAQGRYTDKWGRFQTVPSGSPRFCAGPLGRAIQLERLFANLASPAHPTAGNLGWSPGSGTPTVEWVSDHRSPYAEAGGCVRVRRATGSTCQIYKTSNISVGGSSNTRIRYSLWIRGNVRGYIRLTIGSQTVTTGTQYAYPDRWTRWDVDVSRTTSTASCGVLVNFEDDGIDRTAYIGPHLCQEIVEYNWPLALPHWDNAFVQADLCQATVPQVPGGFSFSVASRIPTRTTLARLWNMGGGADAVYLQWNGDHLRFWPGGGSFLTLTPPSAEWDAAAGRPCVITARMGRNSSLTSWWADLQVAYTATDGGTVSRWTAIDTSANIGDHGGSTQLTIGASGDWYPGDLGISWLRYDGRTWTDIQRQVWERCILEAAFRDVFALTQGRKFLLGKLELETIPGSVYQKAIIEAREQSADADLAVLT